VNTSVDKACKGVITEWNEAKGYGFVDDGKQRVFAHIRDFTERPHSPQPGDKVTYTLGTDRQGRTCAQRIILPFTGVPLSPVHFVVLAILLVTPGIAIARLFWTDLAWTLAGWVLLSSAITYGLYAWDKRRAQRGEWRIAEKVLHLWELLGGWPGAFLAQRRLRHKSAKLTYLFTFWLIVILHHYLAIDAQLDWRLFHQARAWVVSLS
jgi:uncharacterized membrane protein YsdA (DUF1294 family)/cold shock CspA family protein